MVLPVWIEHTHSPLPRECSTTELRQRAFRSLERAAILAIGDMATQASGTATGAVAVWRRACLEFRHDLDPEERQIRSACGAQGAASGGAARKPQAPQGPSAPTRFGR